LLISLFVYATITPAEVVFDGSLGPAISLEGTNFEITDDFGKQYGGNLFHSFKFFNLDNTQTAIFSGPNTITNIIGRITGGEKSSINGVLRSTIPQADLYLINPEGFIFSEGAALDLQGSLYISTASQLRLGNSGTFEIRHPERSILVSAQPSAFGFLDVESASIEINGSELEVLDGETLSMLGGEIKMNSGQLQAVSGRINIAAITEANKLKITATGLNVDANATYGKIDLTNNALVDVGKFGTGDIYIRGGRFFLDNSTILANTLVDEKIDKKITVTNIDVSELSLDNEANIDSRTFSPGQGGQIIIKVAGEAKLAKNSKIRTNSAGTKAGTGDAGDISLETQRLTLFDESTISSSTLGPGLGGNIDIEASESIDLENSAAISSDSFGRGNAGNIYINTKVLEMNNGGKISTAADNAKGGNIIINARTRLIMNNSILSATVAGGQGNGGNLAISNPRLFSLINDSQVIANAIGGNGGFVLIITDALRESYDSRITASSESGREGDVKIDDIYNIDISTLPIEFLDVSNLIKKRCAIHTDTQSSSFFIKGRGGLPNAPDDLQPYIPISIWK
jgi:filamentous hemagglutinin family protein